MDRKRAHPESSAPAPAIAHAPELVPVVVEGGEPFPPGFVQLWRDETLCDAKVLVQGETFHAHRCVLAAQSGFFSGL